MSYLQLFKENNIIEDLGAVEKKMVIEEMLDFAVSQGVFPKNKKKSTFEALLDREKLGSTGLGHGVAIPHVKIDGCQERLMLMARSKAGVDFSAVDGEPVYILFLLVSSTGHAEEHLSILQWISRMARHQDFSRFVRNAKNGKEICGILKELSE